MLREGPPTTGVTGKMHGTIESSLPRCICILRSMTIYINIIQPTLWEMHLAFDPLSPLSLIPWVVLGG